MEEMHLQENTFHVFDICPCCPVPSTLCDHAATKYEVARSNGSGGDTFTRNVTDAWMHRQMDR